MITLATAVDRGRQVGAGEHIAWAESVMEALYIARDGMMKSRRFSLDGDEYVESFHLPGEIAGLEGFARGRHSCDLVALEPLHYCRIPRAHLERCLEMLPGFRRELLRLFAESLEYAQRLRFATRTSDARGRLAGFLLDLSLRLERRGFPATTFRLGMSRRDIASYVSLTPETVSRVLVGFRRAGWIDLRGRRITLLSPRALTTIATRRAARLHGAS